LSSLLSNRRSASARTTDDKEVTKEEREKLSVCFEYKAKKNYLRRKKEDETNGRK
tara:strand:- start:338 stop:502 length:165 start_codon:yes stop_codon:yes gene_type:complete